MGTRITDDTLNKKIKHNVLFNKRTDKLMDKSPDKLMDEQSNKQINSNYMSYEILLDGKKCGNCLFVCFDKNEIYISSLYIAEKYQGHGYGTMLLYEVLNDAYNIMGMKYVSLNDISDKCHHAQGKNIYMRLGMYYPYGDINNKMYGDIQQILYGKKDQSMHWYQNRTNCLYID